MPGRSQFKIDRDRARRHASKQERDLQAQKAASSRPGQVYHTMTSLADRMARPGYQNNQADINQLKSLRRDWNRNQKYTPQGMQVSGVTTPMGARDAYVGMSRDLRQGNKPAYNKMYPLTGGFMDIMDKGGIWGAMLSGLAKKGLKKADPLSHAAGIGSNVSDLGKGFWGDLKQMGSDIFGGIGIGGAVPRDEATEEVLTNYADQTFPGDEVIDESVEEVYEGPWPHADMPYLSDEAAAIQKEFNTNPYFQNLKDPNVVLPFEKERRGHPHLETYTPDAGPRLGTADPQEPEDITVAPWLLDPSLPMPEELTEGEYLPGQFYDELIEEEAPPPIIPFDDSLRESGIASMMKSGLNLAGRRPYEDEYRAFVESSGPSEVMVTYEDFMENYLPRIQESRGVFRAGLNSQGRR